MRNLPLVILLLAGACAPVMTLEDTRENREQAASRYLEASPPAAMMRDAARQMAMKLPPENRAEFVQQMADYLDIELVNAAVKSVLIKNLTVDELKALADFYGSMQGQTAMEKLDISMGEVIPLIQDEIVRARNQAQADLQKSLAQE